MAPEVENRMKSGSDALKALSLTILVFQNSALSVCLRYSRKIGHSNYYHASTAIIFAELCKMAVCIPMMIKEAGGFGAGLKLISTRLFSHPFDLLLLTVPSGLYTIQNTLQYFAAAHLDSPTFQLLYQAKLLTTALFSVILLQRSLHPAQWGSLVLLGIGVALVQLRLIEEEEGEEGAEDTAAAVAAKADLQEELMQGETQMLIPETHHHQNTALGFFAVMAACVTSGLAGVFFEKVLKGSVSVSLWGRNFQLCTLSVVFAILSAAAQDGSAILRHGVFAGYTGIVWVVILLQAGGGLLVSVVVKYADNVAKGFATSLSIVLSALFSWLVLGDITITLRMVLGASMIISATFIYGSYQVEAKGATVLPFKPLLERHHQHSSRAKLMEPGEEPPSDMVPLSAHHRSRKGSFYSSGELNDAEADTAQKEGLTSPTFSRRTSSKETIGQHTLVRGITK